MNPSGITVRSNDSFENVRGQMYSGLRDEIRASQSRRRYLEKVACIVSRQDLSVELDSNVPSAYIDMENSKVVVTSGEHEQPATDLEPNVYDLIRQEGHLLHEVAHALWTDHDEFQAALSSYSQDKKGFFKQVWNILEDGAIERQLASSFNVETELLVKNANMGHFDEDEDKIYGSFGELMGIALYDLAKFDTGELRAILNSPDDRLMDQYLELTTGKLPEEELQDFVDAIKPRIADIKSASDASKRTQLIRQLFNQEVVPRLDWDELAGESPDKQDADAEHDEESQLGEGQNAEGLEGSEDEVEEEMEEVLSGESSDEDEEDGDDPMGAGKEETEIDEDDVSGHEEELKSQIQSEGFDESEMEQQFERLQKSIEGTTTGSDLKILTETGYRDGRAYERYNEAKNIGRRIGQDLQARLQREKRAKEETHLSEGSFDSRRMVAAARGDYRVFKQLREGDEKDYHFVIVFDRSGSMQEDINGGSTYGGNEDDDQLVYSAEVAVGSMIAGLETVGVDTEVIDMYDDRSWIAKHWHESLDQAQEKIFRGQTAGLTPIHSTLEFAIEEARGKSNPVVLVVTDGDPDDRDKYREQLEEATVPVIGMYVRPDMDEDAMDDDAWFHRQEFCSNPDGMMNALQRLVRGVML